MLGIIICDDDRFMLETSVKAARKCITDDGLEAGVVCMTTDFREVLHYINKNPGVYLYFLDIDFGKLKLNGVDIAKIIKKADASMNIAFMITYLSRSFKFKSRL